MLEIDRVRAGAPPLWLAFTAADCLGEGRRGEEAGGVGALGMDAGVCRGGSGVVREGYIDIYIYIYRYLKRMGEGEGREHVRSDSIRFDSGLWFLSGQAWVQS